MPFESLGQFLDGVLQLCFEKMESNVSVPGQAAVGLVLLEVVMVDWIPGESKLRFHEPGDFFVVVGDGQLGFGHGDLDGGEVEVDRGVYERDSPGVGADLVEHDVWVSPVESATQDHQDGDQLDHFFFLSCGY